MLATLREQLETLVHRPDDAGTIDFAPLLDMAAHSQELALEALQQLNSGSQSRLSILSGATLTEDSAPIDTTKVNYFGQAEWCQAAVLYRTGRCEFQDLAVPLINASDLSWACRMCSAQFTHSKLLICPPAADHLWINAAGLMKAHCTPLNSKQHWKCIWAENSAACRSSIPGKRQLLKHMLDHHTGKLEHDYGTFVDQPSELDSRPKSRQVDSCGYGVEIGGRGMQQSRGRFVISGKLRR